MMKRLFRNIYVCVGVLAFVCSACNNDTESLINEPENGNSELPEGYFHATFFPQPKGSGESSRAAVKGNSEQIQSLICIIYRQQSDGSYSYVTEKNIITYTGAEGNITPQTYEWPLKKDVAFDLPSGDYKAVFVGNIQKALFTGQGVNDILTDYKSNFASSRINMPELGPKGFNNYNMFYLCTVDFSPANPSPSVLLQRIVANNIYSRTTIDDNEAVTMLVDNIVADIRKNELSTELVHQVLKSKLLVALQPIQGITDILTPLVDRLVNMLLGDVLEFLNETLIHEIVGRLQASLKGDGGLDNTLLGLNYILNPWTTVNDVNVTFSSLPKSVDFNRECRSYYGETTWTEIPLTTPDELQNGGVGDYTDVRQISLVTLSGDHSLKAIDVNTQKFLLASALSTLDEKALNGLLVNIHAPLGYSMSSNLQYRTPYELINLTLSDFSRDESSERLQVSATLGKIVNLEELVKQLLGENIISGLIGGLTDQLIQPIVNELDKVVLGDLLDLHLPALNLNNIAIQGGWDVIHVSDGTIAPIISKLK